MAHGVSFGCNSQVKNKTSDDILLHSLPRDAHLPMMGHVLWSSYVTTQTSCTANKMAPAVNWSWAHIQKSPSVPTFYMQIYVVYLPEGGAVRQYSVFFGIDWQLLARASCVMGYGRGQKLQRFRHEWDFCITSSSSAVVWPFF